MLWYCLTSPPHLRSACFPLPLIFLLLGGCSKSSSTSVEETVPVESAVEAPTIGDKETTVIANTSDEIKPDTTIETSTETPVSSIEFENVTTKENEPSDLFKSVYLPYARREKPFLFNAVKAFAQSSNYEIEIDEPTAENIGTIKFIDTTGDYVYFSFNLVNNMETIVSISYYQISSNSEVILNNYSPDGSPKYDEFTTHIIGESSVKVNDPEEQQDFLFN